MNKNLKGQCHHYSQLDYLEDIKTVAYFVNRIVKKWKIYGVVTEYARGNNYGF